MMGPEQRAREIALEARALNLMAELGLTYPTARFRAAQEEHERDYEEWQAAVNQERQERDAL